MIDSSFIVFSRATLALIATLLAPTNPLTTNNTNNNNPPATTTTTVTAGLPLRPPASSSSTPRTPPVKVQ
jgi:hypothetical protein